MKILRVGDPHIQVSNLKDANKLMDFVLETAEKEEVDVVEFLGDLFHTHAILRVEVLDFWNKSFQKIKDGGFNCRVLVGNHDQPGSKEKEQIMNALNIFQDSVEEGGWRTIINEPKVMDKIGYIPYMSNEEAFLIAAAGLEKLGATKLLVAHQTFTGATYENGFYAEDGIDPALVPQEAIISGHIHKQQQIGKCWYQGTPKWDTMSDANEDKGIWVYEHNKDGSVASKDFFSTAKIVTPIYKHTVKEGDEEPKMVKDARNYIEFIGKSAWITKMKKKYKGKAQIKARPTDRKSVKIDSKDLQSINDFLSSHFEVIDGVNKKDIKEYLESINESA